MRSLICPVIVSNEPTNRPTSQPADQPASPLRQFDCHVSYIRRCLPYIPPITAYSPSLPDRFALYPSSNLVARHQSDREIYSSVQINPNFTLLPFEYPPRSSPRFNEDDLDKFSDKWIEVFEFFPYLANQRYIYCRRIYAISIVHDQIILAGNIRRSSLRRFRFFDRSSFRESNRGTMVTR